MGVLRMASCLPQRLAPHLPWAASLLAGDKSDHAQPQPHVERDALLPTEVRAQQGGPREQVQRLGALHTHSICACICTARARHTCMHAQAHRLGGRLRNRNLCMCDPRTHHAMPMPCRCSGHANATAAAAAVQVRVYDFDVAGPDLLGSFDVPLHKITAAELAQLDDEIQVDGKKHKGRVLKMEGTKLVLPEQQIESTLDVWLYFTPDLPLEITLEEVAKAGGGRGLDPDYEQRCRAAGSNPAANRLQPGCNPAATRRSAACKPTHRGNLQPRVATRQAALVVGCVAARGAARHCGCATARVGVGQADVRAYPRPSRRQGPR